MMDADFFKQVMVVIVLFRKELSKSAAYQSFVSDPIAKTASLLIYDNSPESAQVSNPDINYYHDPRNGGVSAAYNYAFAVAKSLKKSWLIMFDQDTVIPSGTFSAYASAVLRFPQQVVFVPLVFDTKIVSPYKMSKTGGQSVGPVSSGLQNLHTYYIINSGMLISVEAFATTGGYDERFPLDFSDVTFCERLKENQSTFVVINGRLQHRLSASEDQTYHEAISRFQILCAALRLYKSLHPQAPHSSFAALKRGIRLFFKYGKLNFLRQAMKTVIT